MTLIEKGNRVALHPATDWWMRGATHGKVVKVGRKLVHVQLEVGGALISKVVRFRIGSDLIEPVALRYMEQWKPEPLPLCDESKYGR